MIIEGKYNTAKVFTEDIESGARGLIETFCNSKVSEGTELCLMPDVHPAKGCCIGTVLKSDDIFPGLLGGDIGCGISSFTFKAKRGIELEKLDKYIHQNIPCCMKNNDGINQDTHAYIVAEVLEILNKIRCTVDIPNNRVIASLCSLGGGNHFIELGKSTNEKNTYMLTVHSGSRNLGPLVSAYAINIASHFSDTEDIPMVFGRIPKGTEEFDDIFKVYELVQKFAFWNRRAILTNIISAMKWDTCGNFNIPHNYLEKENDKIILHKGSISVKKDQIVMIPLNMRDGIIIGKGKGNPEWMYSAPHGSGRLYDRKSVADNFTVNEFKKVMKGIYSSTISKATLDECPMAYKPSDYIIDSIKDTVEVKDIITPIYNFKGGK